MNRLTTVWLRGGTAPNLDRPTSGVPSTSRTHVYCVDGSADEYMLWIEEHSGQETLGQTSPQRAGLPLPPG
jgi:hypothetical protein